MSVYRFKCAGCGKLMERIEVPRCSTCGDDDFCESIEFVSLATLAHNIQIAAALCRAFAQGWVACRTYDWGEQDWAPGCGKATP